MALIWSRQCLRKCTGKKCCKLFYSLFSPPQWSRLRLQSTFRGVIGMVNSANINYSLCTFCSRSGSIHKPLHSDNIVDFSFIDKKQHRDEKATQSSIKSENVQLATETRWIEGFVNVKANFKILHSISNYKLKVTHRHTTQKWLRWISHPSGEKNIFFGRKFIRWIWP